jgi:CRP-like cAMP-binding protein
VFVQDTSADSFYFIKTGIVSLVRTLATCEVNVKTLGAGEVFGETSLFKGNDILTFPHTALCDTMTVLYRVDRMQITKDQSECFANDATLATKIAAYPDDATLIKSHLEEQKFKKQRDIFIRNFRKKK